MHPGSRRAVWLLTLSALLVPVAQGDVVEEIVALVDGDILTKSEYDREEQAMIQDIYRRFAGEELDEATAKVRRTLMMDMIDRKILVHRAERMFDTEAMANAFYDGFRRQQQIEDDAALQALLDNWGMTEETLRKQLIETFAPDEVVRFEVSSRVSVADHEVDAYYAEHPDEFRHEDEVKLREIVLLADTDGKKAERRDEINGIHGSLTAETFARVASEISEAGTKEQEGLLGNVKRGDLSGSLEEVAFGLQPGEFSGVLDMPYGFHVVLVEERRVGASKSLEDVRVELRAQLEDELFSERMREFMLKARGESEWCVKEKYASTLATEYSEKVCKEM
jgi:parvulin-like peptidyl-prolyl isomerase